MAEAARVKRLRHLAWGHTVRLLGSPCAHVLPCNVNLVRVAPRAFDPDNLASAFKAIQDGVAQAFGVSDDGKHGLTFSHEQRRGKPKEYAIVFEFTRVAST
jgi:hypothetical protein